MTQAQHSSESNEHYTPLDIVEAARTTLGTIDLDPASCAFANRVVRAATFYDIEADGLSKEWSGRVFLNPPGGKDGTEGVAARWWGKLAAEFASVRVTSAIFVGFTLQILQTTQRLGAPSVPLQYPMCFPSSRIAYDRQASGDQIGLAFDSGRVSGGQPPHASVIMCVSFLPDVRTRFCERFQKFGRIVVPGGDL